MLDKTLPPEEQSSSDGTARRQLGPLPWWPQGTCPPCARLEQDTPDRCPIGNAIISGGVYEREVKQSNPRPVLCTFGYVVLTLYSSTPGQTFTSCSYMIEAAL